MKLRVFHAGDGDCLLLESTSGHHVLIDGGRTDSFKTYTEPEFEHLSAPFDLVVVSHIDADHISGIVRLLQQISKWTAYDHQIATSEPEERDGIRAPEGPRPPTVKTVWHNSWRRQLGDLAEPTGALVRDVESAVDLAAPESDGSPQAGAAALETMSNLAYSMRQGEQLIDLVDQCGLPVALNKPFRDMVMLRKPVYKRTLGSMSLSVLGPSRKYLDTLREDWQEWLDKTGGAKSSAGAAIPDPAALTTEWTPSEAITAAQTRIKSVAAAAEIIDADNSARVTPPNRASIILLATEGDKRCLLTGDAAAPEILEGLRAVGMRRREPFRCNVLKVQHHGSENNINKEFVERVIAQHYVFCGDGASKNPDPSAVRTIAETRRNADPNVPFTLWFNTSETKPDKAAKRQVMAASIAEARRAAEEEPELITVRVLSDDEPGFIIEI